MTNPQPLDSSTSQLQIDPEVEQGSSFNRDFTWLKELKFLVAVVIIFFALIEYKVRLPAQNVVVDVLAVGIITSLVAPIAGIPIHRAIAGFIKAVFEVPWS